MGFHSAPNNCVEPAPSATHRLRLTLSVHPEVSSVANYPSISLFFPAWNEEDYVERAVTRALDVLPRLTDDFEIIVVNDASTDRTQEIADGLAAKVPQLKVITHPVNLKLGGAMRTGLSASTKDIVVYSDIDLPWDLRELERALHLMEYLEADMICAFRFDRTSEGPKRILYSFVYNLLIRSLFDINIKDVNFSFKVMHRRVLESLELKSLGSFIDAELVVKAIRKGFRVFQMGVDYFPRTRGVSTLASPSVIMKMVRELVDLYPETRSPTPPTKPVRLPPDVAPLHSTPSAWRRKHG
jgi:glycosyltransferase involved in cell wall biosynthesis